MFALNRAPRESNGRGGFGAPTGADVSGGVTSEGHNLLGRSDGCTGFAATDKQGGTTNETRLDPKLGPLANYGGPTETLALLAGSPAINAGSRGGPARDQRSYLRKRVPDIGAFEYNGAPAFSAPAPPSE